METYIAKHDDIVKQASNAIRKSNLEAIVAAFVGSLSTRNMPARSAFGSYVVLQHLKPHKHSPTTQVDTDESSYCGLTKSNNLVESDDRVLNYPFQVQHAAIHYSAFDLATFKTRTVGSPTGADCEILTSIIGVLRKLPKKTQLADLNRSLQGILKSNKDQRTILLETFGYAGILCPADKSHYSNVFTTYHDANAVAARPHYKMEWEYPVRFWRGRNSINEKMANKYFGAYL